jgi:hypothetical protein
VDGRSYLATLDIFEVDLVGLAGCLQRCLLEMFSNVFDVCRGVQGTFCSISEVVIRFSCSRRGCVVKGRA